MFPSDEGDHRRAVCKKDIEMCSGDHNYKVLLAHALNERSWVQLSKMCDEMTSMIQAVTCSWEDGVDIVPEQFIIYDAVKT